MKSRIVIFLVAIMGAGLVAGDGLPEKAGVRHGVFIEQSVSALKLQEDYELVALVYRFSFPLSSHWELNLEPRAGYAWSPEETYEIGLPVMLRLKQLFGTRWTGFVEGGVGPIWLDVETYEQGCVFNFIDQVGLGLSYAVRPDRRFEFGCRFRHVSNAGLDRDNGGINGTSWYVGVNFGF